MPVSQPCNEQNEIFRLSETATVVISAERHLPLLRLALKRVMSRQPFTSLFERYVCTSASELGNNLIFHTNDGGTMSFTLIARDQAIGIEIVARDRGPGIADIALAMQENYSTNGGLGGGLPAVRRMMDELEIDSQVGIGTRIRTRKWQNLSR